MRNRYTKAMVNALLPRLFFFSVGLTFSVVRTNQSMFQYKVLSIGDEDTEYRDVPLQNCWVEEILVLTTKSLDTSLSTQFGFFPKAEVAPVLQAHWHLDPCSLWKTKCEVMERLHIYQFGSSEAGTRRRIPNIRFYKSATDILGWSTLDILVGSDSGQLDSSKSLQFQLDSSKCATDR